MSTNHNQLAGSYDFILPFFKAVDPLRPALTKIHAENGFVYATDAHIAIRVPESLLIHKYAPVEKFPNCEKLLNETLARPVNNTAIIRTDDLIHVLTKAKWQRDSEGIICEDCGGCGEITCEACGHDHSCGGCDGKGTTGTIIGEFSLLESESFFKIGINGKLFNANLLHVIAISARMLRVDEIEYIYNPNAFDAAIFRFAGIDILLMSVMTDASDAEIAIFKPQ